MTFSPAANFNGNFTVATSVSDGALATTGMKAFTGTAVNDAPTDISISNAAVSTTNSNGTVVGALSAIDPDAGDMAAFSLVNNAGGQFAISGGNLVVASALTAGAQQVIVRATDSGGLSFDKTLTINVSALVGDANANTLVGTAGDDAMFGLGGNDKLQGLAGNDTLDGGQGFDRAVYSEATSGITVNLAAGTITGGAGNDTLINVEGIVGSDQADTYNATGFAGDSGVAGTNVGLNEFEGRGGNDTITGAVNSQGALLTRISYVNATAAVTVDLNAHSATGDVSVGSDTLIGSGFAGVVGSRFDDTLSGSANAPGTVEVFEGRAGNDTIDGRGGFDRADYALDPAAVGGINVQLAAGTVTGDAATVGTDILRSIESVRGSNNADTFDATGFGNGQPTTLNIGNNGTFNEFNGMGGNDNIIGNGNTRIAFTNATGGVIVDLQTGTTPGTGTADGDTSTGHDTFTGVNAIHASMLDDTLRGSNSTSTTETFYGAAGNDLIDGRGGFDIATYDNIYFSTGPVTIDLAAGTATGDASIGNDTLRSIEGVQGTNFNDVFVATGYGNGQPATLNVGNNGTFNQFEGLGGNDTITGNGNTRVIYANATTGVKVNLATGTASGDASVGTDTIVGGVNSAGGSAFGDTLTGDATSNTFQGNGGNDIIDGGAGGDIAVYTGASANYTISINVPAAGQTTVADSVANHDGTDTLTSIEIVQFTDASFLIASGSSANPVDISDNRLFFGAAGNPLSSLTGSADDFVKISQNLSNRLIDLGAGGNDTIMLGVTGGYNLNLANVERLVGTGGDDFVGFLNNVSGLSIDMGGEQLRQPGQRIELCECDQHREPQRQRSCGRKPLQRHADAAQQRERAFGQSRQRHQCAQSRSRREYADQCVQRRHNKRSAPPTTL